MEFVRTEATFSERIEVEVERPIKVSSGIPYIHLKYTKKLNGNEVEQEQGGQSKERLKGKRCAFDVAPKHSTDYYCTPMIRSKLITM